MSLTDTAMHALKAARMWDNIGRYAAIRYIAKRGIPLRLVILARQLEAVRHV